MRLFRILQKIGLFCAGLLIPVMTYAFSFTDVSSFDVHFDAISALSDEGIINGYNDGSFHPEGNVNRAELIKTVVSARLGRDAIDNCIADNAQPNWHYIFFPDVPVNEWYAKYICAATTNGFVSGYSDGNFHPDNYVNFAEGLKIILNAHNIDTSRTRLAQNKLLYINNGDWFASYFSYAYNKNLINRSKFYHPGQLMTRGEFAEILYRLKSIRDNNLDKFPYAGYQSSEEYTITIPRLNIINLNVSFADPYNSKDALGVLKNGMGNYLYPPGEGKKIVLFGHSSGYSWDRSAYKNVLRQINKLQTGDMIYINYHEKGYVYQIFRTEIMPAKQLASIMKDYGYEELNMYTCWPPDSIKQRYVVYAGLV